MRLFGKHVDKSLRSDLLGRLGMIILTGLLLVVGGVCSFAWFSQNRDTDGEGLTISVRTKNYDLLIDRTSRYATGYPVITDADHTLDSLEADAYDLTATSTESTPALAYELINEYRYENKYNLMPGSYGTLTFYLRPKTGVTNLVAHFSLALGGYVSVYDNEGNESFEVIDSTTVLNLLKGHILFFTQRTGATFEDYRYDGLLLDGTFAYDTTQHTKSLEPGKTDCYAITLYWEWPITYYDIVDELSTAEVTRRFPVATSSLLSHNDYFFLSLAAGADDNAKADAYNDADQAIGNGADSIVVYISAK